MTKCIDLVQHAHSQLDIVLLLHALCHTTLMLKLDTQGEITIGVPHTTY